MSGQARMSSEALTVSFGDGEATLGVAVCSRQARCLGCTCCRPLGPQRRCLPVPQRSCGRVACPSQANAAVKRHAGIQRGHGRGTGAAAADGVAAGSVSRSATSYWALRAVVAEVSVAPGVAPSCWAAAAVAQSSCWWGHVRGGGWSPRGVLAKPFGARSLTRSCPAHVACVPGVRDRRVSRHPGTHGLVVRPARWCRRTHGTGGRRKSDRG